MKTRHTFFRISKLTLAAIIGGCALSILTCQVVASVEGCGLFYNLAWSAFQILRPAILAVWQSVPMYICGDSTSLQRLMQVVASIWPPACITVG